MERTEGKSVCADSKEFRHNLLVFPLVSFLLRCFSVKHVVYTHLCVNFSGVISDTGQALCKQGGQSWASECGTRVYCSSLFLTPPGWGRFWILSHRPAHTSWKWWSKGKETQQDLNWGPHSPLAACPPWLTLEQRGLAEGSRGSFGRSVYTRVSSDMLCTVSGSVFYLLVKYQHQKERNSTKSTILTLHIPTITAEITQQFLSYMSAKKASATNHLFFVGGVFFLAILYLKNCECSSIFLKKNLLKKKQHMCSQAENTHAKFSLERIFTAEL